MVTIAFFEIPKWEQQYIKKKLKGHKLLFFEERLEKKHMAQIKEVSVLSVFIYSQVSKATMTTLKKLKLIVTRSTGFDHIDVKYAKTKKITVSNVPFYGENTVAEHAFALILSLSRNIHKSYLNTIQGNYSIDGLTGFDLKNKTMGIIGGGHIGMHVARIAQGFGMNILVYDVNRHKFMSELLNFSYAELDELYKKSDIISLHAPYVESTHHVINKEAITKMKKGVILINTARGGLVDTNALFWGLNTGKIGGAGLDVIEGEEHIQEEKQLLHQSGNEDVWKSIVLNHKIFTMDNVIFTPHNAFNSQEALYRILDTSVDNIQSYLNGDAKHIV